MYTPPADPLDEPEHVARYLSDAIEAIWLGLDVGRTAAEEFFDSDPERRVHDAHMWAHVLRYEMQLVIDELGTSERDWSHRILRNSGVEIVKGPFTVRLCKAIDAGPPNPGRSRRRREYFQQLGLSLFGGGQAQNLILYWMVKDQKLELGLCKPKGLWNFRGSPRLAWRQPIIYDPLEGLLFAAADEDGLDVALRFDDDDLDTKEGGGDR